MELAPRPIFLASPCLIDVHRRSAKTDRGNPLRGQTERDRNGGRSSSEVFEQLLSRAKENHEFFV